MAKPKLALVPAAQGSKFYSVLPSDGVGDFDFARASAATRINKYGLIETVASGQSRLNYPLIDGVVNGCPHHILEPVRINLINYSEDYSQWINSNSFDLSNQIISPSGILNATKLITNNGSTNGQVTKNISKSATAITYTYSVFAKKGEWDSCSLYVTDTATFNNRVQFFAELNNGNVTSASTAGTFSSASGYSEYYGNGWYRFNVTFTTGTETSITARIYSTDSTVVTGDGASGIYIWGAQLEAGSYPTSYIVSNSGSATTRVAETANNSGDASTFNDSEGVLMAEISALDISTTNGWISVSEDANINNNQFNLRFVADSNLIQAVSRAGGLGQDVVLQHTLTDKTTTNKIAIKYKLNDWALWVNGVEVDTENSSNAFTTNSLDVLDFDRGNNSNHFYGKTKQLQYYDSALTDSELETLTSWTSFSEMAESQQYSVY